MSASQCESDQHFKRSVIFYSFELGTNMCLTFLNSGFYGRLDFTEVKTFEMIRLSGLKVE